MRMTRYLESWGAAKPFAHLHHRDSMTTENGKISTMVRRPAPARPPPGLASPVLSLKASPARMASLRPAASSALTPRGVDPAGPHTVTL